jgi:peptidyl-prolyl cis-trans isomerase C
VRKLLAAGASFEALAMERSIDSATRFNGGDLGYFTADVMPEVYITALKSATSGAVVGPIKTDTGYAVLKVEDRRPEEPITLEAARPQIVRFLTYDQVRELLESLRKSAKIQTLIGPPLDVPGAPSEPASAPPEAPATAPAPVPAPVPAPAPAAKPGKPS